MNFNNNEITLLSEWQIFGSRSIDSIRFSGAECAVSDFAILLGASVSNYDHVEKDKSLKGRTCYWYSSSSDGAGDVRIVNYTGHEEWISASNRSGGIRPVLSYKNNPDILQKAKRNRDGSLEVEYGEYPQYAVDKNLADTLESLFLQGRSLKATGKSYTTDSRDIYNNHGNFQPIKHDEYE